MMGNMAMGKGYQMRHFFINVIDIDMIDSIKNVHVIDKIVEVTLLYVRHLLN